VIRYPTFALHGIFPVTCMCLLLLGCQQEDRTAFVPPQFDTVGTTVLVRNGPIGAWDPSDAWTIEEDFRIGGLDVQDEQTPAVFGFNLLAPQIGPHGLVSVFSANGDSLVRRFGGSGQGPGELTRPNALAFDKFGRAWISEHFARPRRWSVFDSTGTFVRTVPFPAQAGHVSRRVGPARVTDDGRLVFEMSDDEGVGYSEFDTTGVFLRASPRMKRPPWPPGVIMPRDPRERDYLRFRIEQLRWSPAPNETAWVATSGPYRLLQVSLISGDTLRIVEVSHRGSSSLSARERGRIDRILSSVGSSASAFPLVRPLIDGIHVTDDGHVLVQVVDEVGENTSTWDVFSPDGVFLGTMKTGFSVTQHGWGLTTIVGDTLLTVTEGAAGVPFVIRATIHRPKGDPQAVTPGVTRTAPELTPSEIRVSGFVPPGATGLVLTDSLVVCVGDLGRSQVVCAPGGDWATARRFGKSRQGPSELLTASSLGAGADGSALHEPRCHQ
jgi:hypothetical protein